jgi:large subunit ribosomal protein L31
MRSDIHPEWHPEAKVTCACGNTWTVGATVPEIRVDICSNCHPYYTGEQRIVDTEGQVDRFMRRLRAREEIREEARRREEAKTSPAVPIIELDLKTRIENLLLEADIEKAGDVLDMLEEGGDESLLDIRGFGLKALADLKKTLRSRGYVLPGDEPEEEEEAEAEAEPEAA